MMNNDVKAKPKCRDDAMVIMLAPEMILPQCVISSDDEYVEAVEEFIVEPQIKKKKAKKEKKPKVETASSLPLQCNDDGFLQTTVSEHEKESVFVDAVEEVSNETVVQKASSEKPIDEGLNEKLVEEVLNKKPVNVESLPEVSKIIETVVKVVTAEKENLPPASDAEVSEKTNQRKKRGKSGNKAVAVVPESTKPVVKQKLKCLTKDEEKTNNDFFNMINSDDVEAGVDWATIAGDIADTPYDAQYENLPTPEEVNVKDRSRTNSQAQSNRNRSRNSTNRNGHRTQGYANNANKAQKMRSGPSIAPPSKQGSNDVRLDRKFTPMTGANAIPVTQNVFTHANPPIIKQKNNVVIQNVPPVLTNQVLAKPLPLMAQLVPKLPSYPPPSRPSSPTSVKTKTNIFGDAKPVDTAKKLKEIEAKKFAQPDNDSSSKSSLHGSNQSLAAQVKPSTVVIYRTGYEPDHCNQDLSMTAAIHDNLDFHNKPTNASVASVSKPSPSIASSSSQRSSQTGRIFHRQQNPYKDFSTASVGNNVQSDIVTAPVLKTDNKTIDSNDRQDSSTEPKEVNENMVCALNEPQQQQQQVSPLFSNDSAYGVPMKGKSQNGRSRQSTASNAIEVNHQGYPPSVSQSQYYGIPMQMPPVVDGQPQQPFMFVGPPPQQGVRYAGPPRVINPNIAPQPHSALLNCQQGYFPGSGVPVSQHLPNGDGSGPRSMQNGTYFGPSNGGNGQPLYSPDQGVSPQYIPSGVPPSMMSYPQPHPNQPQVGSCYVDYSNGTLQQNGSYMYMVPPTGVRLPVPVNYGVVPQQAPAVPLNFNNQKSNSGTNSAQFASVPPPGMVFPPSYMQMMYSQPPPQPFSQIPNGSSYYGPQTTERPQDAVSPQILESMSMKENIKDNEEKMEDSVPDGAKDNLLTKETKFNPNVPAFIPSSKRIMTDEQEVPQQDSGVQEEIILDEFPDENEKPFEESPLPPPLPLSPVPPPRPLSPPPLPPASQTYTQVPPPPHPYHQPPPPLMPHQYHQGSFPLPQQQSYPPQQFYSNGYNQPLPPQFFSANGFVPQPLPPNGQYGYPRLNFQWPSILCGAPPVPLDSLKPYPVTYGPDLHLRSSKHRHGSKDHRSKTRREGPKMATVSTSPPPAEFIPGEHHSSIRAENMAPNDKYASVPGAAFEGVVQKTGQPNVEPTEYTVNFTVEPKDGETREPTPEVNVTLPLNPPRVFISNKKARRSHAFKQR